MDSEQIKKDLTNEPFFNISSPIHKNSKSLPDPAPDRSSKAQINTCSNIESHSLKWLKEQLYANGKQMFINAEFRATIKTGITVLNVPIVQT